MRPFAFVRAPLRAMTTATLPLAFFGETRQKSIKSASSPSLSRARPVSGRSPHWRRFRCPGLVCVRETRHSPTIDAHRGGLGSCLSPGRKKQPHLTSLFALSFAGMKRNSDGETGPAPKRPRPMGDTELRLLVYSKVRVSSRAESD